MILENLEKFGALKAIGAKGRELVYMILFMATFTAMTGYGLGIGLVTLMITIAKSRLPNYAAMITFWNLGLAFGMVLLIAGISSYIGIRKVLKIEPFDIFRGSNEPFNENHNRTGMSGFVRRMQLRAKVCETVRPNTGRLQRIDPGAIKRNWRLENRRAKGRRDSWPVVGNVP